MASKKVTPKSEPAPKAKKAEAAVVVSARELISESEQPHVVTEVAPPPVREVAAPVVRTHPSGFKCIRQNDPAWGKHVLGNPKHDGKTLSIGGYGCLLTALTMAGNFLKGASLNPDQVNHACIEGKAFDGPLIIAERCAQILGFHAPDKERYRTTVSDQAADSVSKAMKLAFDQGKICILHIDHDSANPGGDIYGDHFIVAFQRSGTTLHCGDPAPGSICDIDQTTTFGSSIWIPEREDPDGTIHKAVVKAYRVVGVIPCWAEGGPK